MGFRFQRRVTIAPGIRLNFGLRGMSLSLGPRGASINIGSRGIFGNVGLPGTGISYRDRLDRPSGRRAGRLSSVDPTPPTLIDITIETKLNPDGSLRFTDAQGLDLPPKLVKSLFEQKGDQVRSWLEEQLEEINRGYQEFVDVHVKTPPPVYRSRFARQLFSEPPPATGSPVSLNRVEPKPPRPGAIRRLANRLPGIGPVLVRRHKQAMATYGHAYRVWLTAREEQAEAERRRVAEAAEALAQWQARRNAFKVKQDATAAAYEQALAHSIEQMAQVLERVLGRLNWSRETSAQFEIEDGGRRIMLDVDLPEVEDAPTHIASLADNGRRLHYKELSDTARRRDYAQHVHGVALRLAGEVFTALPTAETAVISGYTQRTDPGTAREVDDYLYSVRLTRTGLAQIDIKALRDVDPVSALERFEHRRSMSKTGVFKAIEPFAA